MKIRLARKMLIRARRGRYSKTQIKQAERVADCHIIYGPDGNPWCVMDNRPEIINVGLGAWLEAAKRPPL